MIYEFKSRSTAPVVFTGSSGDWLLSLIGKAPGPAGIVEPADMPAAMQAIESAIAHEEARRRLPLPDEAVPDDDAVAATDDNVTLRQRAWPFVDLLKRSHLEGEAIVWGA